MPDVDGKTVLHIAVESGNYKMVKYLLDKGASVQVQNVEGRTPLHLATNVESSKTIGKISKVIQGQAEVLDLLDQDGLSAAHWCAFNNRHKHIGVLASAGADVALPDGVEGKTPLHWCAANETINTAQMILKYAPDCIDVQDAEGRTALHRAIESQNMDLVTFLIAQKLLFETTADLNIADAKLHTPLHLATALGYYDAFAMLLENGADPMMTDDAGATALHYAAQNSDTEGQQYCLMYLTQMQVTDVPDASGRSAVMWAAASGNIWALRQMAADGYVLLGVDSSGGTSLHVCAAAGFDEVAQVLIESGAEVNALDNTGQTPLFKACEIGQDQLVFTLLEAGGRLDTLDAEGRSPLHGAALAGSTYICQLLVDQDVKPTLQDAEGRTALHAAAYGGMVGCMKIFINGDHDTNNVNIADKEGICALHWAASKGTLEGCTLLVDAGAAINPEDVAEKMTPLDYATIGDENGIQHHDVIDFLTSKGGICNAKPPEDASTKIDQAARVIQRAFKAFASQKRAASAKKRRDTQQNRLPLMKDGRSSPDRQIEAAKKTYSSIIKEKERKKHERRQKEKRQRELEANTREKELAERKKEQTTRQAIIINESSRIKEIRLMEKRRMETHRHKIDTAVKIQVAYKSGTLTSPASAASIRRRTTPMQRVQRRTIKADDEFDSASASSSPSKSPKKSNYGRPSPGPRRKDSFKDIADFRQMSITPEWKLAIAALTIQLYWRKYKRRQLANAARRAKKEGRKKHHKLPDWISTVIVEKQNRHLRAIYATRPFRTGSYVPSAASFPAMPRKTAGKPSPAVLSFNYAIDQYSASKRKVKVSPRKVSPRNILPQIRSAPPRVREGRIIA